LKLRVFRVSILLVLVIVVIGCFTLRLMRFQITDGASYRLDAARTKIESIPVAAPRGEILDRNGVVLATNSVGYSVILERTAFPSAKSGKENDTILELTNIMSANSVQWADTLPISKTQPYSFNKGSDADVKGLKTMLNIKDKQQFNAEIAMNLLKKNYAIPDGYSQSQLRTIIGVRYEMDVRGFSVTNVFNFAKNVDINVINEISERSIPGIDISEQYTRTYPEGTVAPQVIGNVGPMNADQYKKLKQLKPKYSMDAIIGQMGIESSMEKYLRGVAGKEDVDINAQGTITGKSMTVTPKPGDNVVLTIDSGLQKVVQQSLQDTIAGIVAKAKGNIPNGATCKAGTAVVLNVKTGEVLAMASYPGYDNSTYYQDYASISSNTGNPLLNRAVQSTYRPGSTYKPCVATSALMNGVVTKNSIIECNGSLTVNGLLLHDDASYGPISIVKAIGVSSNVFFYTLAMRLDGGVGSTKLEQTAKALGFGQKTGIELPVEAQGVVSGPTEKKANGQIWEGLADAAQSGIGQLDNLYTPIQLANYVGTIVNGGKRYQVHIVKQVKSYDNSVNVIDNKPKVVSDLKIPADFVNTIKQGMYEVTKDGTAAQIFGNYPLQVGGKTGTSQVPLKVNGVTYKAWNGLFLCFAPYNNPQIVIAVAIENAHWGADAAPVAQSALDYLFLNKPDYAGSPLPTQGNQLLH
jgi:penicillin-binding protein 2